MLDAPAGHGDAPALVDAETLSYRGARGARQPLRALGAAQGLAKGETVGLLMPNRPDYMAAWLGITRRRRGGAAQHQPRPGARALHDRAAP